MDTNPSYSVSTVDSQSTGLEGRLGVTSLVFTALAFNAPIGGLAGLVPVVIAAGLGPATPLVYLGVMLLMLLFGVGLVAMARHMAKPGAFYTYITHAMGRSAGLGAGFAALATYVVLASATYIYMGIVMNSVSTTLLNGPDMAWWVWVLIAWAVVSALSLFNIEVSVKVLGVLLALEVLIVLVWDLRVFVDGGPEGRGLDLTAQLGSGSWGLALLLAVGCLTGFESIQVFRAETRNPDRTVPRATYLIIAILAGLYGLSAWAYLIGYGYQGALATAADPSGGFFGSLQQYAGKVASDTAQVLVVSSLFAAILAIQNISARYTFALGRDGVLPASLGRVHPRWKAPTRAAVTVAAVVIAIDLALAIAKVNEVTWYVALQGLGLWGLIALMAWSSVSIIVFFRREPSLEPNLVKTLVAPILSTIGFVAVVYLSISNSDVIFGKASTGYWCMGALAAIAIFGVAYAAWLKTNRRQVWTRIGAQDDVH